MTYREWYESFARRHEEVLSMLDGQSPETIYDYFDYENMKARHPDFCPLYREEKKCHDLEGLNCYLCGCPYFRYCDEGIDRIDGKIRYSLCAIDAKQGRRFETETAIHQDCSQCFLPHLRGFILRHFDRDWKKIMHKCEACGTECGTCGETV